MKNGRIVIGVVVTALLASWLVASAGAQVAAPAQRSVTGAVISVAKTKLGRILVDSRGRTVYLFERDAKGQSACYGQCAKFWPPVLSTGKPKAGTGAKASLLGLVARKDGTRQVTYAGHPLYRFLKDTAPGMTTGEGLNFFGGGWYVLAPSGAKIEGSSTTSSSSSSSSSGGYGYGG